MDFSNYAGQIIAEHEAATAKAREAVTHAIRAGEFLNDIKEQMPHGAFGPWVRALMPFSERTAQRYMKLAAKSDTVSHFPTIREALAALEVDRPPRSEDEPMPAPSIAPAPGCWRLGTLPDGIEVHIIPSTAEGYAFLTVFYPTGTADEDGISGGMAEGFSRPIRTDALSEILERIVVPARLKAIEWQEFDCPPHEANFYFAAEEA